MREIWIADSETDPFKAGRVPAPFIWGAYNGIEYHEFTTTDAMVDFFRDKDVTVYAHNGGKFDWFFILDHIVPRTAMMIINGRLSKFTIGECEFRDSYNILPLPLRAFQKDDFDYTLMEKSERDKPEVRRKIQEYLKNDCVYLYRVVMEFIQDYGFNLTLAGSALKMWESISGEKAPETSEKFYNDIAPYYYGGRVECFKTGLIEGDFKVIDINSAYPFAMLTAHPYGETYTTTNKLPKSRAYIERAFITLTGIATGSLPFRGKDGLEFPRDNTVREYNITGWEYLAAIETNTLRDCTIKTVLSFSDSIEFTDYVTHFYNLKNEAKKSGDNNSYIFAKLFLNSLYGKFGSNPKKYREFMSIEKKFIEVACEHEGYTYSGALNADQSVLTRPIKEEQEHYYNVAVAASITGFVRAYLFRAIEQCEGVMYCDTDSIACRDVGSLKLDPSELGAWDVEAECISGGIAGKKLYAFLDKNGEYKTASKGVRLGAEEILEVAKGNEVRYEPESPSFSLKRGISFIGRNVNKTKSINESVA